MRPDQTTRADQLKLRDDHAPDPAATIAPVGRAYGQAMTLAQRMKESADRANARAAAARASADEAKAKLPIAKFEGVHLYRDRITQGKTSGPTRAQSPALRPAQTSASA